MIPITMKRNGEWLTGTMSSDTEGVPYGQLLREHWGLPRKTVHLLFQYKDITVNDHPITLHTKAVPGDIVSMKVCPFEEQSLPDTNLPLHVLYEDDHLLIVNKPAGQLLHPTENKHRNTLDHAVTHYFNTHGIKNKPRHVHRLDQHTSGAVLYAKHPLASAILDEQLREKEIYREYIAYVHGSMSQDKGTIDRPIGRDKNHPTKRQVDYYGDDAITQYEVIEHYRNTTKLRCRLETGRTHQIRVHLEYFGFPIIGDTLYGGSHFGINRPALHAYQLSGNHPFGGERFEVVAPLPQDLQQLEAFLKQ